MNFIDRNFKYFAALLLTAMLGVSAVAAFGQEAPPAPPAPAKAKEHKSYDRGFCSNDSYSSDKRASFREVREYTVPASSSIAVDAGTNGGISVKGEDRSDILIRACVQTSGESDEAARAAASNIRINTAGEIRADGTPDRNWWVSYQLRVPRQIDLDLKARNGGISISNVDGKLEFETNNGGLHLDSLAGDVKGRTTNGGIHVTLAGTAWRGAGLDLQTTNGGVKIAMPENYAANIETGTVNGGFRSGIPALSVTTEDIRAGRDRAKRINTSINGGGAPVRIVTTNGGVNIGIIGD